MKLSVCVDAVFSEIDFYEAAKEVKKAGICAIEFWSWWDKDLEKIRLAKEELGIEIAAFCTKMVSLIDPSRRSEYLNGLQDSIEVAKSLGCTTLITQVGSEMETCSREVQHQALVEGLKVCAPILEQSGMTLVFEPLNTTIDHKGYYLSSSTEAFEIAKGVSSRSVKVLFDIYHQQIMKENLIAAISENIQYIGHFHAAGDHGRNELFYGDIDYPEVFQVIRESDYKGYVGLEYFPKQDRLAGLDTVLKMIDM